MNSSLIMATLAACAALVFPSYYSSVRSGAGGGARIPLATMLALAAATVGSVFFKHAFEPLWVEDLLVIDAAFGAAFLFIRGSRSLSSRKVVFAGLALVGGTTAALLVAEWRLKSTAHERPGQSRIGREIHHAQDIASVNILNLDMPGAAEQEALHARGVRLTDYFGFQDEHVIPPRGREASRKRVLWLGDSMTAGNQAPQDRRFAALLEERTGAPHYVLAVDGTATDFAAVALERYFDLITPDFVMLGFYSPNDCFGIGLPHERADFHVSPLYDIERGELAGYPATRWERLFLELRSRPPSYVLQAAARRTHTGNLLLDLRERFYWRMARTLFYDHIAELRRDDYDARFALRTEAACKLIRRMDAYAKSRGAQFAVAALPFKATPETETEKRRFEAWRPGACHAALLACMQGGEIPFLDLQAAVSQSGDASGHGIGRMLLPDAVHMNERGHRFIAERLAPLETSLLSR